MSANKATAPVKNKSGCFVLPYETADGPANMALDEALLDWVARGGESAYLRTYGWTVPTLSLGYFQSLSQVRREPRWASVPVVRRPTGGGAIWHEHEVTYALVVPTTHPMARSRNDLYRIVHAAIADLLGQHGARMAASVDTDKPGVGVRPQQIERKRPLLCFTDRNQHDIVIDGFKVLGSAQRRRAGAVLQHGSLLLDLSARTPELRGVRNVADITLGSREWADRLLGQIPGAVGLEPIAVPVPDSVRERAQKLEDTVYRNMSWTALFT